MVSIYILQLEQGKYYIGRTINADLRIDKHFSNNGSYWTSKYKPIKVIKVINNCSIFDEDKYTLHMMSMYGIDNVRGGSFTKLMLPENEIEVITKMINNSSDYCFNCYEKDHFIRECPYEPFSNMQMVINTLETIQSRSFLLIHHSPTLVVLKPSNNAPVAVVPSSCTRRSMPSLALVIK